MATIIFDFDDTLINTSLLNEHFIDKLVDAGVDKTHAQEAYHLAKVKFGNYTAENHLNILADQYDINKINVLNWFENFNIDSYVFPDYVGMLENLKNKHNLIIVSKGEDEFQNFKIKNSGLNRYFNEIHITPKDKEIFLQEKNFTGPIVFINDKNIENKKIKELFPHFQIIEHHKEMNAESLIEILNQIK